MSIASAQSRSYACRSAWLRLLLPAIITGAAVIGRASEDQTARLQRYGLKAAKVWAGCKDEGSVGRPPRNGKKPSDDSTSRSPAEGKKSNGGKTTER